MDVASVNIATQQAIESTAVHASNWELKWVHTGLVLLIGSGLFYAARLFSEHRMVKESAWGLMLLSFLSLAISLVLRSQKAEYFALSNMYESLLVVIMSMQIGFMILDRWFDKRALGFPVALMIIGSLFFDLTLPTDITPLQPALQSYWRSIHVPIILMSYALFTLAFLSSVVYLVKDAIEKNSDKRGGQSNAKNSNGMLEPLMATGVQEIKEHDVLSMTDESSNVYDEITYRCVAFGIPLLAIGIILGGLWANEAWGNYWSWDPKESMSLVTLLGFGVYLHLRVNGEHSPRVLSWVAVAGFALLLVTYFGVNIMGVGLHSYGKIG